MTWRSQEAPPQSGPISPLGWARLAVRGAAAIAAMVLGLSSCAIARLIEIVFRLPGRPCGPWVSKVTYRVFLAIMRVRLEVVGAPMSRPGAIVSNHVSWIDILALGTASRSFFVAKAEVARWPIIGLGASLLGTAFVTRSRADAAEQRALFEERLRDGHRLVFFPEGTSTDGHRVLPFKSTLFAAFFSEQADPAAHMQPVTVDLPRTRVRGSAPSWLVGRHGIRRAHDQDPVAAAQRGGPADLPPADENRRLSRPQGPCGPCRARRARGHAAGPAASGLGFAG